MTRKSLIRSNVLPYHVTARTNNREAFHLPLEVVWKTLAEQCFEATVLFNARPHAFLLMPNHFHLLISTPAEDLGMVMHHVQRSGTQTLNRLSGRTGHVFGGRYHWTLVDTPNYFAHAYKYVYRNPVKARLSERVEDYPFNTLRGILGHAPAPFPLYFPYDRDDHLRIPNEMDTQLEWLNRPFKKEHDQAIQKALRRTQFSPPGEGWKRTLQALKDDLL